MLFSPFSLLSLIAATPFPFLSDGFLLFLFSQIKDREAEKEYMVGKVLEWEARHILLMNKMAEHHLKVRIYPSSFILESK